MEGDEGHRESEQVYSDRKRNQNKAKTMNKPKKIQSKGKAQNEVSLFIKSHYLTIKRQPW